MRGPRTAACLLVALLASAATAAEHELRVTHLVRLSADPGAPDEDAARARGLLVGLGTAAAPAIADVAQDPAEPLEVRLAAVRLLARIGGAPGVSALTGLSREASDVELRWAAIEALATFDDADAVPALVPLLWDPTLAPHALWALSPRASPALLPALVMSLGDATTHPLAIEGIATIGTPAAVEVLRGVAARYPAAEGYRAIAALLRCGPPDGLEAGLELLGPLQPHLRSEITRELLTMGPGVRTLAELLLWARAHGGLDGAEVAVALALARQDAAEARAVLEGEPWVSSVVVATLGAPLPASGSDAARLLRLTGLPEAREAARAVVSGERPGDWGAALAVLGDARTGEDVRALGGCLDGPVERAAGCLDALVLPSRTLPAARDALAAALDGRLPVAPGIDLRTAAWRSGVPELMDRVRGQGLGETPGALGASARRPLGPAEAADRRRALGGPFAPAALEALADSAATDAVGAVEAWTRRDGGAAGLRALGRIGGERAARWLGAIAADPASPDRIEALEALARIDSPRTGPALAAALDPSRPELFLAAARGLERSPWPGAAEALRRALTHEDGRLAVAAARALAALGDVEAAETLRERAPTLARELQADAAPLLDPADPQEPPAAVAPEGPTLSSLDALIAAARTARAPVAAHLRPVVMAAGGPPAELAEALAAALRSWEPDVRAAAAPLAVSVEDPLVATRLLELLRGAPPTDELRQVRAALERLQRSAAGDRPSAEPGASRRVAGR